MREEHDPIEQVRRRLTDDHKLGEDELKAIDGKVRSVVNDASEFATHDPEPDVAELWTDVLLEGSGIGRDEPRGLRALGRGSRS